MKPPRDLQLPYDNWRPGQRLAIRTALHSKTPHVVIQAPTGSGKSLVAAALTRLSPYRSVILTATKGLMEQYGRDYGDLLYDVRGMANYECLAATDEFKTYFPLKSRSARIMCDDGPCRSGAKCTLKDNGCLYFDRYRSALASNAVLTNYSYWLSMRRFGRGLGLAQQLVCDEAHALPEQLMSACRIEIPHTIVDSKARPKSSRGWKQWAEAKIESLAPGGDDDFRHRREKLVDNLKALAAIDETWAWDTDAHATVFEPTIPRLLMPMLHTFDAASTIVYLSATITPAMLRLLDIDDADVTFMSLPSHFPLDRRPVYLVPGGRVDYRMTGDTADRWHAKMAVISQDRRDRKGIYHTVSYARQSEIVARSPQADRMIFVDRNSAHPGACRSTMEAVERFKASPQDDGAILVGPQFTTGWDFPMTDAEYQIICKVPFPNTQSAITRARVKATAGYRDHLTSQNLIQACGRIVRSDADQGETFIVDEHVNWFLEQAHDMIPSWFAESIVKTRRTVRPPERLVA